jgi:hypothetical protein
VQRRARRVLKRVSNGIADNRGFVGLRAFAEEFDCSGVGALGLQVASLDVLLGVIPGAADIVEE